MNSVYGNGEASPEAKHCFTYGKSKNEQKTPLFIFTKHMINEMDQNNASRIERYVEQYCKVAHEDDAKAIRELFQIKISKL